MSDKTPEEKFDEEAEKAVRVFGEKLDALMRVKHITKKEMAKAIGISPTMLGYYFCSPCVNDREEPVQPTWKKTCKMIYFLRTKIGDNYNYDSLFGISYTKNLSNEIAYLQKKNEELKLANQKLQNKCKFLEKNLYGCEQPD